MFSCFRSWILSGCLFPLLCLAQPVGPDRILGYWLMPDVSALLNIRKNNAEYEVYLVAVRDPLLNSSDGEDVAGQQRLDAQNPDPSLRDRPLSNMILGRGFQFQDLHWRNGRIYDPVSGNVYQSQLSLQSDGLLKLTAYIGLPFLGRTVYLHPATPLLQRVRSFSDILVDAE